MKQTIILFSAIFLTLLALTLLDRAGAPRFTKLPPEAPLAGIQYKTLKGPAPDFRFTTLDGQKKHLRDFRGKIVVLNFWATWCPPCVTELPDLVRRVTRENGDVILIAVSSDDKDKIISNFLTRLPEASQKQLKAPFIFIARDPERHITRTLYGTVKYPETVIIGPDGQQIIKIIGVPNWDTLDLKSLTPP